MRDLGDGDHGGQAPEKTFVALDAGWMDEGLAMLNVILL